MKLARVVVFIGLFLLVPVVVAAAGESAATARSAVVRLDVACDPLSIGPGLLGEISAKEYWTPYETELYSRLDNGSMGTGFMVNERGDLITNAHVVLSGVRDGRLHFTYAEWDSLARLLTVARDIWVTVGEGEEERSYLTHPVAVAEDLDLAVLRLSRPPGDASPMPYLRVASSDELSIGDTVRAVGFAQEGYQDSSGSVLSLIRGTTVHGPVQFEYRVDPETGRETVVVRGTRPGFVGRFQHSASVSHGSSGGPVIDAAGCVVGVSYALLTSNPPLDNDDARLSGLNLAISSEVLKQFLRRYSIPFVEPGP
ncbi:MAG: trypsin-like peptidase domain-containing protein [Armatimonadetes bacterium]|nr:trypsin-like peptidase domain-containing protein [Armatimonadota bacterium]